MEGDGHCSLDPMKNLLFLTFPSRSDPDLIIHSRFHFPIQFGSFEYSELLLHLALACFQCCSESLIINLQFLLLIVHKVVLKCVFLVGCMNFKPYAIKILLKWSCIIFAVSSIQESSILVMKDIESQQICILHLLHSCIYICTSQLLN